MQPWLFGGIDYALQSIATDLQMVMERNLVKQQRDDVVLIFLNTILYPYPNGLMISSNI